MATVKNIDLFKTGVSSGLVLALRSEGSVLGTVHNGVRRKGEPADLLVESVGPRVSEVTGLTEAGG